MKLPKYLIPFLLISSLMPLSVLVGFFDDPFAEREVIFKITSEFATTYTQKQSLNHYFSGYCAKGHCALPICSFALAGEQQIEVKEAKKLAHGCVKSYISYMHQQPEVNEYFMNSFKRWEELPRGFQTDYVGIRIGFWTKEMNRMMPPYIAEIRFFDKAYHYYQANPETQALVLVCEEPYEDLQ